MVAYPRTVVSNNIIVVQNFTYLVRTIIMLAVAGTLCVSVIY